jgi:hypothetical protein
MKRYTLVFRAAAEVEPAALRTAAEEALDRLHPRIACRMESAFRIDPQSIAVEISSEGKKEDLAQTLRAAEKKLPAALDRIEWGWDSGGTAADGRAAHPDPLAAAAAASGPAVFESRLRTILPRYLLLILLSAILAVSGYEKFSGSDSTVWDLLFFGTYVLWLFLLSGTPFNPFRLARRIECGDGGIAVFHRFRREPVRAGWGEIGGLDFSSEACILRTAGAPIRFALGSGAGIPEEKILLKTIVERAQLRFVEGRFRTPFYRRADAP